MVEKVCSLYFLLDEVLPYTEKTSDDVILLHGRHFGSVILDLAIPENSVEPKLVKSIENYK